MREIELHTSTASVGKRRSLPLRAETRTERTCAGQWAKMQKQSRCFHIARENKRVNYVYNFYEKKKQTKNIVCAADLRIVWETYVQDSKWKCLFYVRVMLSDSCVLVSMWCAVALFRFHTEFILNFIVFNRGSGVHGLRDRRKANKRIRDKRNTVTIYGQC